MSASAATTGLLACLLLAALVARPLIHGVEATTILAFWATVLGQLVLPGVALVSGARLVPRGDRLLLAGLGTTLGLALQGLSLIAGRALGLSRLATLVAISATVLGLALESRRRGPEPASPRGSGAGPRDIGAALAVMLIAVVVLPLASAARPSEWMPFDLLFHGGVAAELRHRWPLQDPRVAGVPLQYHLLAYAMPVAAADLASAPVADTLFTLAPLFWLPLLALLLECAGRALFAVAGAGVVAAAILWSHADPGRVLGLGPGAFNSFLATGIYGSPTTLCGFVLLGGLTLSLHAWLERGERQQLGALALLALAASAAKTTVLPVVLAALALVAAACALVRRGAEARRLAAALAVTALAGAPLTLWQNSGTESYSTMARPGLAAAFRESGFAARAADAFGPSAIHGLLAVPAFGLWLAGYLGLAGVAALVWLLGHGRRLSSLQAWALGVLASGLAASLVLDAPGLSQLFLVYNGQLLLALFAGAALAAAWRRPRGLREWGALAALALAALPNLDQLAGALPAALRQDAEAWAYVSPPVERDYVQGLAWLRAHASRDAVVFADNPSLLLSAIGEVRLYYENGLYTARSWRVAPGAEPWPERAALQQRLLRRPDAAALGEARRAIGAGPRLLVVADSVQSRIEAGVVHAAPGPVPPRWFLPQALFARPYLSPTLQVYEAREPPELTPR